MNVIDKINALLEDGVNQSHFPGAQYAIVKQDGTIYRSAVGFKRTHPDKQRLQGDEIYDIASLSKVVSTTTLIMKLIEQKQLYLDTKVADILPRFHHQEITIEHLLTHSSGLPADIPKAYTLRNKDDVASHIFTCSLIHPVGSTIVYSDIGYMLLGFVVEKITKKPLYQVAQEWIFSPLGMDDTSYHPPKERCAPTEYREDFVYKGYLQGQVHDEKAFALQGNAGHAGVFSTVQDLAKFIVMFLQENTSVLSKETMDLLFPVRQEGTSPLGNPLQRAYGWDKPTPGGTAGLYIDDKQTILHTGFTGCNMWIDRHHKIGFVMLSNAVHPKRENNGIIPYRRQIADLIMKDLKENHK